MSFLASKSRGQARLAGKSMLGIVTMGAGNGAVGRKDWIEEQPATQSNLGFGQRVILRHRSVGVQPQRDVLQGERRRQGILGQAGWLRAVRPEPGGQNYHKN